MSIVKSDCLEFLRNQPEASIDLVFGSPPYEEARLYLEAGENMGISRKTADWVAWMVEVHVAAQRACRGLVAFVVAGQTDNYRWSAGPALYMAALHKAGLNLRNPPIFSRVGIPGSGGPDWLRSDYEWIVCTTRPGKLPWSDNTAMGHAPKYKPGGAMSYRNKEGERKNARGYTGKPKSNRQAARDAGIKLGVTTSGVNGNGTITGATYLSPDLANPGNIVHCKVGGGKMGDGDVFAAQNEAPFSEDLVEFFLLSFCPPGGTVCDCFSGSGTTAAVAKEHGRDFIGCDLRESQVQLGLRRVSGVTADMFSTPTESPDE